MANPYHLPAAHFTFFSDTFYKVLFVERTHEVNYTILRATESTLIIYMSSLIFFHYFIGVLFSLLARTYVCAPCVHIGSCGIGVTPGCEPLCRCWDSNLGPLEEQPVLLTAEPYLQAPTPYFIAAKYMYYLLISGVSCSFFSDQISDESRYMESCS